MLHRVQFGGMRNINDMFGFFFCFYLPFGFYEKSVERRNAGKRLEKRKTMQMSCLLLYLKLSIINILRFSMCVCVLFLSLRRRSKLCAQGQYVIFKRGVQARCHVCIFNSPLLIINWNECSDLKYSLYLFKTRCTVYCF